MSAIGGTAADESRTVPAIRHDDRVPLAAWVIAAANVVLMLAVSDRYGFQQDELYFLVASHTWRSGTWTSRHWRCCSPAPLTCSA